MIQPAKAHNSPESGYAMLLVFALSAMVAIGLYQQLPRAAFEAQREKEQRLIDHGEQYKRSIQLYYRKLNRYPTKIEDLENTQNIRFLRRRFIDPMTGKDEWRLVHMGPGGKLIDSKVQAAPDPNKDPAHQSSITEFKSPGADDGAIAVNLGTRKRASDELAAVAGSLPGGLPGANPGNGSEAPPLPNVPNVTGQIVPGQPNNGVPGLAGGVPGVPGVPAVSPERREAPRAINTSSSAPMASWFPPHPTAPFNRAKVPAPACQVTAASDRVYPEMEAMEPRLPASQDCPQIRFRSIPDRRLRIPLTRAPIIPLRGSRNPASKSHRRN